MSKIKIAIFASGSGSNAENIYNYFQDSEVEIALILSNSASAYVLERAKNLKIPSIVFNRQDFFESNTVIQHLKNHNIDLVVLAGFLWLVPKSLVDAFPQAIVNIHPALLPKYGGKGMYGDNVHKAVEENKETETGISIHYVNEHYDEGAIIAQYKTVLSATDDYQAIAKKVHELEYEYFPKEIEKITHILGSKKI